MFYPHSPIDQEQLDPLDLGGHNMIRFSPSAISSHIDDLKQQSILCFFPPQKWTNTAGKTSKVICCFYLIENIGNTLLEGVCIRLKPS